MLKTEKGTRDEPHVTACWELWFLRVSYPIRELLQIENLAAGCILQAVLLKTEEGV